MRIFGRADKPKKYQESVRAEAARVEQDRSNALKEHEKTLAEIRQRVEQEIRAYEALVEKHTAGLRALEEKKASTAHAIRESSVNFKATQTLLNNLEAKLGSREAVVAQLEQDASERVANAFALEDKSRIRERESKEELAAAKKTATMILKEATTRSDEARRREKQAHIDAEKAQKALINAEKRMNDANMQVKRAIALESNLIVRERALERRAAKLASKEAALIAAEKEYGKNRR